MAIHKSTPIIILAIWFARLAAFLSRYCDAQSVFEAKFSKQLLQKPIKSFLKEFRHFEINPSIKSRLYRVPWIDEDGVDTWVVIEKAIISTRDQERELTTKINDLAYFRQSSALAQMIACVEMTTQRRKVDRTRSEDSGLVYEATEVYIVYEDSNHTFADEIANHRILENFRQLLTIERVKVYWHLAQGLRMLHDKNYIYGHISASEVLGDEKNPRIAKFSGMHKISQFDVKFSDKIKLYDPFEAVQRGIIFAKSDVYSFGILVAVMEHSEAKVEEAASQLLEFGPSFYLHHINNKVKKLLSSQTEFGPISSKDKRDNFTKLISECINEKPSSRPTASELEYRLEKIIKILESELARKRNRSKRSIPKDQTAPDKTLDKNEQTDLQSQLKPLLQKRNSNLVIYRPKSPFQRTQIWTILGVFLLGFILVTPVVIFGMRNISM